MVKQIKIEIVNGHVSRFDTSDDGGHKTIEIKQYGSDGRPLIYTTREERAKGIETTTVTTTLPYIVIEAITHSGVITVI